LPGTLGANGRPLVIVGRTCAGSFSLTPTVPGTAAAGTTRAAFEKITNLSKLGGGEDRLELSLDVVFKCGDLLELAVGKCELVADERRENVSDSWSTTAGEGGAALSRWRWSIRRGVCAIARWGAEATAARGTIGRASLAWPCAAGSELGAIERSVVVVVERFERGRRVADFLGRELSVAVGVERCHNCRAGVPAAIVAGTPPWSVVAPSRWRWAVSGRARGLGKGESWRDKRCQENELTCHSGRGHFW